MKVLLVASLVAGVYSACGGDPKPTIKSTESVSPISSAANTVVYIVDTALSVVRWEGYEGLSLGKAEHDGTVNISGGELNVDSTSIASGEIKFDIKSILVKDIPATSSKNGKLTRHLLSEDFFEVSKFPEAKFVITSITRKTADSINVAGNLTLKSRRKKY